MSYSACYAYQIIKPSQILGIMFYNASHTPVGMEWVYTHGRIQLSNGKSAKCEIFASTIQQVCQFYMKTAFSFNFL